MDLGNGANAAMARITRNRRAMDRGIPGSGNSVLVATIIEKLDVDSKSVPVLFFFARNTTSVSLTPRNLVQYWLCQLLDYNPILQQKLKDLKEAEPDLPRISFTALWRCFVDVLMLLEKAYVGIAAA